MEILRTSPHKAPINGPGAWKGSGYSGPGDYTYRLCPRTLDELDRALRRVKTDIFALTAEDFPLPSFEQDAAALRARLKDGDGFVVVKGLPIDRYTEEEARIIYWGLGSHLGRPIRQKVVGGLLYSVRDEGYNLERDYGAAGVRTSKTTAGFNYHTDSPSMLAGHTPDIVCLLALQTAKSGGESAIVSANTVHNAILEERPEYLDRLYAPYDMDRRAELPPGEPPTLPVPVFAYGNRLTVRYLRFYITKGAEVARKPLTPQDNEPLDFLDDVMRRPELPLTFGMEPGDIQFVNNVFILHSRAEYKDHPEPERKRHYVRLWLKHK
ncbi:MAG TPA: TauD/TfdA family dioxygenase [Bryobacteraceae bacterium]|nr:TauD/TfdA family dioxygenase [Bryobacteraceae bacterium]